jgi:hypothetical protein
LKFEKKDIKKDRKKKMSFENLKKHKERKKEMYRWASSEERKHFKTLKSKTLLFRFTLVFISSPSVHSAHSLSQQSVRFHFLTSTWFVVAAVDISHPPDHHTSLNSLFFVHISHCPRRKREPTFFSKKKKYGLERTATATATTTTTTATACTTTTTITIKHDSGPYLLSSNRFSSPDQQPQYISSECCYWWWLPLQSDVSPAAAIQA